MKAIWNNQLIPESVETIVIEGNHYFPPEHVDKQFLVASETHTVCPWKGTASYYHLEVKGVRNPDAAWYYLECRPLAKKIESYIAFWKGVEVKK